MEVPMTFKPRPIKGGCTPSCPRSHWGKWQRHQQLVCVIDGVARKQGDRCPHERRTRDTAKD